MTTVEAWSYISLKLKELSEDLNDVFIHSGNHSSNIKLDDYETIDEVFKNLTFTEDEMV